MCQPCAQPGPEVTADSLCHFMFLPTVLKGYFYIKTFFQLSLLLRCNTTKYINVIKKI